MDHKWVACHKNLLYLQVTGGGDVSQTWKFSSVRSIHILYN
jgi:hypothetical protein